MNKKILYQAMYVYLLINCFCMPDLMAKSKGTKSVPGTAIFVMAHEQSITVSTEKLAIKEPYLKLEMLLPQINGLQDTRFQKQLNKRIITEAKARKKAVYKMVKEYKEDIGKDLLSPIQFEYIENYTPIESWPPYFVIEQFRYQYNGGAHGLSELNYIILDTQKNQEVTLKDLFKETVDYQSLLNEKVSAIIEERRNQGEFFFSGSEGFQTISKQQPFFINNKGDLVIVFNVYQIAPYAAGPQFIVIPRESLLPYLK